MYIASVGAMICTVVMFFPIINLFAAIGSLVFGIVSLVGLYQAGKYIKGCQTAFILTLVNFVVQIVISIYEDSMIGEIATMGKQLVPAVLQIIFLSQATGVLRA